MRTLLDRLRGIGIDYRVNKINDDDLVALVLSEMEEGYEDKIAKTQAFIEAEGDAERSEALYFRHRGRRLKAELSELKKSLSVNQYEVTVALIREIDGCLETRVVPQNLKRKFASEYEGRKLEVEQAASTSVGIYSRSYSFLVFLDEKVRVLKLKVR